MIGYLCPMREWAISPDNPNGELNSLGEENISISLIECKEPTWKYSLSTERLEWEEVQRNHLPLAKKLEVGDVVIVYKRFNIQLH